MRKTRKLLNAWKEYQQAKETLYQKRKEYLKEYFKCNCKKISEYTEEEWEEFAMVANGCTFSEFTERDEDIKPI